MGGECDETESTARKLQRQSEVLVAALLNSRGDYINASAPNNVLKPSHSAALGCKNKDQAKEVMRKMVDESSAFIVKSSHRGNFMTESALPKIRTEKQLSEVANLSQDGVCMEYPELWDKKSFKDFMVTSESRINNFDTMGEHYRQKLASMKKKKFNPSTHEKASSRTLAKEWTAAQAAERTCQYILTHVNDAEEGTDFVQSSTTYSFKDPNSW